MSGSTTNTTASGTPLTSLPSTEPAPTDLVFGIFNGQGQFVPQSKVWTGAVAKDGDTVTGALSATYIPTEPEHLVPKSYVDAQGAQIVSSVTGAVGTQVTAAETAAQSAQDAATNASNAASGASNAANTAINGQKGNPTGVMPLDQNGFGMLSGKGIFGYDPKTDTLTINVSKIIVTGDLPETADGLVDNEWYNNGGAVYIFKSSAS
ncbi:hypothetical protein [Acetobacter sp. P5B1]|uniref:hypothetical protein n=1 Tax=Acetobacter sp. P5B1 TaxID=2762620 RepID=UPI001C04AEC1|nr:hypothetical protein [Acetobacter sp. P5B1]